MRRDRADRVFAVVNPDKESGRVTLITRYGAAKVEKFLTGHIAAVQQSGHPVIWICDPMHGKYVLSRRCSRFRS